VISIVIGAAGGFLGVLPVSELEDRRELPG
jgi:hypothetical protein